MKSKKLNNKLNLNKRTVVDFAMPLDSQEINKVKGGITNGGGIACAGTYGPWGYCTHINCNGGVSKTYVAR
ncbi:MAG: hypothetical protein GY765_17570 [bacterium]|nr:hypothetical protein [bacterium]